VLQAARQDGVTLPASDAERVMEQAVRRVGQHMVHRLQIRGTETVVDR
jgi:hypothetical protein